MSEKKDCDKESCSALELMDFENALKQFQKLVEKMVIQKMKERLGLYIKNDGKGYSFWGKSVIFIWRECVIEIWL